MKEVNESLWLTAPEKLLHSGGNKETLTMARYPEGKLGELVGLNDGWTHSKTRLVRIIGGSNTTVAVDDNGKRRTFNRSNWYERGKSSSNYAPYLTSEEMAMLDINARNERLLKKTLLEGVRNRLDETLSYTRSDGSLSIDSIQDLIRSLKDAAEFAETHLPVIEEATAKTTKSREQVWGPRGY